MTNAELRGFLATAPDDAEAKLRLNDGTIVDLTPELIACSLEDDIVTKEGLVRACPMDNSYLIFNSLQF